MMPVIDAGVGISQKKCSFSDYLNAFRQFHVLRMVAMQTRQSTDTVLDELVYFQRQATTRGFGGFPNAIVASVDLFCPTEIAELVKLDSLENLRGIHHSLAEQTHDSNRADLERSLNILAENELCLDLFTTQGCDEAVAQMAAFQPTLNIIVNISVAEDDQVQHTARRLSRLAEFDNVYLKICGVDSSIADGYPLLKMLIDDATKQFGIERIMFASGMGQLSSEGAFDHLWTQYAEACSSLKASYRDRLFRSNAMSVYGL